MGYWIEEEEECQRREEEACKGHEEKAACIIDGW
jgi:hypothetical protein